MPRKGVAFAGVTYRRDAGAFQARLEIGGRREALGPWERELDAAIARDRAVLWSGLDLPLSMPAESHALGPCSPEELRRTARISNKVRRGEASRFRGVAWMEKDRCWQVRVPGSNGYEHVQGWSTEEDAAIAYDRLMLGLGVDRADLNFPDEHLEPIDLAALRREPEERSSRVLFVASRAHPMRAGRRRSKRRDATITSARGITSRPPRRPTIERRSTSSAQRGDETFPNVSSCPPLP